MMKDLFKVLWLDYSQWKKDKLHKFMYKKLLDINKIINNYLFHKFINKNENS